jgi:hypothetical protein
MRVNPSHLLLAIGCVLALGGSACSRSGSESPQPPADAGAAATGGAGTGVDRSALPSGHPPVEGTDGADAGAPQGAVISWTPPAGWRQETPSSGMRYAQFRVPGLDGDPEDAECAVFYFGPGQGGSPKDNADRWVGQFRQPDGSSSQDRAKIELKTVNGKQVMYVEVGGTYTASMMGMPGGEAKKDYALIGAIVSGPDAPWFFKLTGPRRTVEASRDAFTELIASIH